MRWSDDPQAARSHKAAERRPFGPPGAGQAVSTWSRDPPGPSERAANAIAADWQLIVQLTALFERNPALISTFLPDGDGKQSRPQIDALLVAAREALAARPESSELHYHTAAAAARSGRRDEARKLLRQALALDPQHAGARALLAEVGQVPGEPRRAGFGLRPAVGSAAVAVGTATQPPGDGRGNDG